MRTDTEFPTPGQLVDKVPLIKNPGFWVPKPVELPQDIHPLPDDVHAYFVYPHSLEAHVLSTLPGALQQLRDTHSQRLHLLASYADSKERARKARLNQMAPGWNEGGGALEPVRKKEAVPASSSNGPAVAVRQPTRAESLIGGSPTETAQPALSVNPPPTGSFLGEPEVGSPKEAGAATLDRMQKDQMLDFVEGLERLDSTFGAGGGGKDGKSEVDDLF
ncbi:hypothetical protein JCM11251_007999 [Rhodosporidiobolus azoricus]